jgi:hypothetical protein
MGGLRMLAAAATVLVLAPGALGASGHALTASYAGTVTAETSGASASATATATGRGSPLGAGTLTGSAHGAFTSGTCAVFAGTAVLAVPSGSITLRGRQASACGGGSGAVDGSFSGRATVTGGTGTFAGARGTVSFRGTYDGRTGRLAISLRGRVSY